MSFADENHARLWIQADEPLESAQRFGDALIWLQKAKNADERRTLIRADASAISHTVRIDEPRSMRNFADRSGKALRAHYIAHSIAMHDRRPRAGEYAPEHRN